MLKKITKKINILILLIILDIFLICGDEIIQVISREDKAVNSGQIADNSDTITETIPDEDSDIASKDEADEDKPQLMSGNKPKNVAVLNDSVIMFSDSEENIINESIKAVRQSDNEIYIDIMAGTAMDSISDGAIVYLGGNESSALGRGAFGKIISRTEADEYISYVMEIPEFDEVFDMLKVEYHELMSSDNISIVKVPEGVNVITTDRISEYFPEHIGDSDTGTIIDFNIDLLKLDSDNADSGFIVSGKVGFEDVNVDLKIDYDILHSDGMKTLYMNAEGNLYEDVKVDGSIKLDSNADSDKVFMLASITYDSMINPHYYDNSEFRTLSGSIPITIEMVVYVDIKGNITQSLNAHFKLNQEFECHYNIVEKNEWIWDVDIEDEKTLNVDFKTEMSGKSDSYLGTAISFNIFNLDIMDFELARLGAESEGELKIDYLNDKSDSVKSTVNATHNLKLYLQEYYFRLNQKEDIVVEDNGEEIAVVKEYPASDTVIKAWSGEYIPPPVYTPPVYVPPVHVPQVDQNGPIAAIKLAVPDYKQYDSRWGGKYIYNRTIKEVGCLVTCMSMIYTYHTGTTVYPDAMVGKLSFYYNAMYWSAATKLGYYYTDSPYKALITTANMNEIYQALKSGKPVIVGGTNSGGGMHWVVVTGYKGSESGGFKPSDFIINDPGNSARTDLSQFLAIYPLVERFVY